ncbi:MFS transporter [Streptomyces fragilis]|uniref:MFS transporter n=1 Tax=Streptomyces fragilis TaxID=67301 RepID=A0ABV2YQB1_9ACTN|nr:MFS transporter [Streptomyces fragilis]
MTAPGTGRARLPEPPPAYRPLFAHRPFRRLLSAFVASDFGDGMAVVTVPWLAVLLAPDGNRGLYVGTAVAAYALPGAVGALVLGRWMRGFPARRLLFADAALRAVMLACVPLAWILGVLTPWLYVVLLAASSLLHAWGSAGKYALLASLLAPERRLAANALVSSSASAAMVFGPALAGVLITVLSPAWIIGIDALTFAVLAVGAVRVRPDAAAAGQPGGAGRPGGAEEPGGAEKRGGAERPAGAGKPGGAEQPGGTDAADPTGGPGGKPFAVLGLFRQRPELLGILALTWSFFFLYGPVEVALPLHVTEDLHQGPHLLGLYWTLFSAGAVLGGLAAGMLRRLPLWPTALGIVAGWGAVLLPFGFGAPPAVTVTCFALGGLIYGPFTALSFTLFQDRTPEAWLTTVLAVRGAALLASSPTGAALGGPLTAALGPRTVLAASGAATLALVAVALVVRPKVRDGGREPGQDLGAAEAA